MGKALYRKYRSKSLDEIIGQEHITHTLKQAIKSGRISHAYLFTGPRGVGKTSIARILAHEINQTAYDDDTINIDIIEIDAASNRRIDEIRDLRERVYIAPTSAKYKVYIIDEVHMLTKEAFNALLKTLEEPPAHVIFILATTDAHKLPQTIISRTQRFTFKPVATKLIFDHLKSIAKKEKIAIDDEALNLIAEHGEGSFRDSISLLDQAGSSEAQITEDDIRRLLGVPSEQSLDSLLNSLSDDQSIQSAVIHLYNLYDQGFQASNIAKQLSSRIRTELLDDNSSLDTQIALKLLSDLIEVPLSQDPERFLEIIIIKVKSINNQNQNPKPSLRTAYEPKQSKPKLVLKPEAADDKNSTSIVEPVPLKDSEIIADLNEEIWPEVLSTLKKRHNTLYGVVRMANPKFINDDTLLLTFTFAFHQKRINESHNRKALADVIHEVTGHQVNIDSLLDTSNPNSINTEAIKIQSAPIDSAELKNISNIFGGAELLES